MVVFWAEQRGLDYDRPSCEPRRPEACTTAKRSETTALIGNRRPLRYIQACCCAYDGEEWVPPDELSDVPDRANFDIEQGKPRWGTKTLRHLDEVVDFCEPSTQESYVPI